MYRRGNVIAHPRWLAEGFLAGGRRGRSREAPQVRRAALFTGVSAFQMRLIPHHRRDGGRASSSAIRACASRPLTPNCKEDCNSNSTGRVLHYHGNRSAGAARVASQRGGRPWRVIDRVPAPCCSRCSLQLFPPRSRLRRSSPQRTHRRRRSLPYRHRLNPAPGQDRNQW